MDFGGKLKQFAQSKFGSVQSLADHLGIAGTSLSRYINGYVDPGKDFFTKMKALDCDLNWLLDEEVSSVKEPTATYSAGNEVKQLREEVKELRKVINQINKLIEQTKK